MKKIKNVAKIVLFSLVINVSSPLIAETIDGSSNENQQTEQEDEIPQALQDIRRFEIITLGALPFVILDSTLVYSGIRYFQNDMSSDYKPSFNPNLTYEEQKGVLLTSLGICLGIGITDLIVNLVTRNKKKKKQQVVNNPILITPIAEDPEAIKIKKPENLTEDPESELTENEEDIEEDSVITISEDEN